MIDRHLITVALGHILILSSQGPVAAQGPNIATAIENVRGDWKIIGADGKVVQDCDQAQHFELSNDRRHIRLIEPWAQPPFAANYQIVLSESERILTLIDDEQRKTDAGDPVLWWFHFTDPDHFRFRRYDWASTEATPIMWERCTPGKFQTEIPNAKNSAANETHLEPHRK